jgi:transcriptional regulator GlxA family with amidase domain
MQRDVAFLIFPEFQLLDLAGPLAAFQMAGYDLDAAPYRLRVLSATGGAIRSSVGVTVQSEPMGDPPGDTLVVVGGAGTRPAERVAPLLGFAQRAAATSRRVASVCTGAFILAGAGLLDGRAATTHWRYAALLQRQYPRVRVDGDRIFVRDGAIWTSAGITAGIDLALALIEDDLGREVARAASRQLVVYHRRPGGQSQFSELLALDPPSDRIRGALSFARAHLHEALPVERLAGAACLSPRQFGRAFVAETGQTPAKAVERLRAEAARLRLETGQEPIELIARGVGFADPERMRRAFLRVFGQPPQVLRRVALRGAERVGVVGALRHDSRAYTRRPTD